MGTEVMQGNLGHLGRTRLSSPRRHGARLFVHLRASRVSEWGSYRLTAEANCTALSFTRSASFSAGSRPESFFPLG